MQHGGQVKGKGTNNRKVWSELTSKVEVDFFSMKFGEPMLRAFA